MNESFSNRIKLDAQSFVLNVQKVWCANSAYDYHITTGQATTKRTAKRRLEVLALFPKELTPEELLDEHERLPNWLVLDETLEHTRKRRDLELFAQLISLPDGLYASDAGGTVFWAPWQSADDLECTQAVKYLQQHNGKG